MRDEYEVRLAFSLQDVPPPRGCVFSMIICMHSCVYDSPLLAVAKKHVSMFSSNFEANASELLENIEEILPLTF